MDPGSLLSPNANFENLGLGMMVLFRIATGDQWSQTMYRYAMRRPTNFRQTGVENANLALMKIRGAGNSGERAELLRAARAALPTCQTQDEVQALADAGVVTCDSDMCMETCGTLASFAFFPVFVSIAASILFNLITAVLLRELMKHDREAVVMITPKLSTMNLERLHKVWKFKGRIKRRMHARLQEDVSALVPSSAVSLEEFEVLVAHLTRAFHATPSELQHKHILLCIWHAERRALLRSGGGGEGEQHQHANAGQSLQGLQEARRGGKRQEKTQAVLDSCVPSLDHWQEYLRAGKTRNITDMSAVLKIVLDVRASKVIATSSSSGNKSRAYLQRTLKQDLCQVLQCPDRQVVIVDVARHASGEPGRAGVDDYGYTVVKVVLLPMSVVLQMRRRIEKVHLNPLSIPRCAASRKRRISSSRTAWTC